MLVLGINNMHDASAALVKDGVIIAAAEEERFNRRKHTIGFPSQAIRYCLEAGGVGIADLDCVAPSWKYWVMRHRITEALKALPRSFDSFKAKTVRGAGQMKNEWLELMFMRRLMTRHFGAARYRLEYVSHHLCHAASTFYVSPFEKAAIMIVDGAGEEATTLLGHGQGTTIKRLRSNKLPHSIGQFYAAITAFLGFKVQADEYKVMGMAAYGEARYADYFRKNILQLLSDGDFRFNNAVLDYHGARMGHFPPRFIAQVGAPRAAADEITQQHMDIAASAQLVVEEALLHVARYLHAKTKLKALCIAGGVGLNCLANGRLLRETAFEQIYVQPAAGDSGAALGAALFIDQKYAPRPRSPMHHAYWGSEYTPDDCRAALQRAGLQYEELGDDDLFARMAAALANGKLLFWFQGRMEWGPRALGNRSLLADPRREDVRELINARVKHRELFRPFAPSVLEERSAEFFGNTQPSPFMLFTFNVNPAVRDKIPAVTHTDGTARIQTVSRAANPRYWRLIDSFAQLTGVPVLLNTSFNVNEPIVRTPDDAINCFLRTEVDYLVLGNLVVPRAGQPV